MTPLNDNVLKTRTLNKIRFLEEQLVSLDHYLPETYEYLMSELDLQRRELAEIEVSEYFMELESETPDDAANPQEQTLKSIEQAYETKKT